MDTKKTCYLFLDFDGTVFIDGAVPKENRLALQAVQKMGHRLILNTGRSRGGLDLSDEKYRAGIDWDGYIFGAGDLEYAGKRIHEHHLSSEICMKWFRYGLEHDFWVHLQAEEENMVCYFDRTPVKTEEERVAWLQKAEAYLAQNHITKLTVSHINDEDLEMALEISLCRMEHYSEIFPKNRHKGTAFLEFCEYFSIDPQQCICFGDSLNDLEIFMTCPNSVCMRECDAELKKAATYLATEIYGVAEAIHHYFGV